MVSRLRHSTGKKGRLSGLLVFVERLALVIFGTFLGLVLLELALGMLSLFYGHRQGIGLEGGEEVVLTLGDSHTYGVFLPPEASYPEQLQIELDATVPGRYRVINLGLPGMGSSTLVSHLPGWIERYRPGIVIVCVGINNLWNSTRVREPPAGNEAAGLGRWLSATRVVRFARLYRFAVEDRWLGRDNLTYRNSTERPRLRRDLVAEGREGVEHRDAVTGELLVRHEGDIHQAGRDLEAAAVVLERDLESMHRMLKAKGIELVLLAYAAVPVPQYGRRFTPNEVMSHTLTGFAERRGLPVVDPRSRFQELIGGGGRHLYFRKPRDDHPNLEGYRVIAEMVAETILGRHELRTGDRTKATNGTANAGPTGEKPLN